MSDIKKAVTKQADPKKKPATTSASKSEDKTEKKVDDKKIKVDNKKEENNELNKNGKENKEIKENKENKDNKNIKTENKKEETTKPQSTKGQDNNNKTSLPIETKIRSQSVPSKEEEIKPIVKNVEDIENEKDPQYNVDEEVVLTKDRMGIIRFKGKVPELGSGIFYGIELTDGGVGHNDGQIKGVRYFKSDGPRSLFVGYEKIRRKMTKRDHKRMNSLHAQSANVTDLKQKYKDGGEVSSPTILDESQNKSRKESISQDDEKEHVVLSIDEQTRQRNESITQHDDNNNNNNTKHKDSLGSDGIEAARAYENVLQFIMRQSKHRDILFDTYSNPQTHVIIMNAFNCLKRY